MNRTSEAAFETVIEAHLLENGYARVAGEGFDRERGIFPDTVLAFIRKTQPNEWTKLEALHGDKTGEQILTDLCKWMDANGSVATLRHGFKCYGRTLRVAFFKAAHARSFRGRYRVGADDHAAGRGRDTLSALQQGL
jgi:type I restriction enzyme R subunit